MEIYLNDNSKAARLLHVREDEITHDQIGKIILLAGELSMQEFYRACEWVCQYHTQDEAQKYINYLKMKINIQ